MPKQPSFKERIAQMQDAAEQLKKLAEVVGLEAIHMDAAAKRFAERGQKRERRARE
jgi:hypothetical protein